MGIRSVDQWYHDHNYQFLIITDHNKFIDPKGITLPDSNRNDFLLIPGEEITGSRTIHTTAMNITNVASWKSDHKEKGCYKIDRSIPYVRAKGTFTRVHPQTRGLEEFYAFGQPLFSVINPSPGARGSDQ